MHVNFFGKFAGSSHPNRTGNKQLKSDTGNSLNLKLIWLKSWQAEGEKKGLRKDMNNMRAVINTSALCLGEEGTKTIGDIKRHMVLMEEENIKLFYEKEKIFLR